MDAHTAIAILALIVSLAASTVAIRQTRRINYLGRLPILAITYDGESERWALRNVGNGPALNIIVAQQAEDSAEWYNPVSIPAILAGGAFTLEWLGDTGDYALGARYSDFLDNQQGSRYFTYTRDDRCSVYLPRQHPKWIMPVYSASHAKRHWHKDLTWRRPGAAPVSPRGAAD